MDKAKEAVSRFVCHSFADSPVGVRLESSERLSHPFDGQADCAMIRRRILLLVLVRSPSRERHSTSATERPRRHRYGAFGSFTVNVVPASEDERTWMSPPWADTIARAMNRPRPMLPRAPFA